MGTKKICAAGIAAAALMVGGCATVPNASTPAAHEQQTVQHHKAHKALKTDKAHKADSAHKAAAHKKKAHKAVATYTVAQENAIRSAKQYLSMGTGFSKAGLITQLDSKYGEAFSKADAEFAVEHIKVSWNHQAVLSARGYLKMSAFSRTGLINQLDSKYGEQFTRAQAAYAATKVGL